MPTWIRVRDTTTGAHFDVEKRSLRYGLEPLNDPRYPDLTGPLARPRPAKVFRGKGGEPAVPGAVVVVETDGGEETVTEPSPTGPSPEVTGILPPDEDQPDGDDSATTDKRISRKAPKTTAPAAQPDTEKE